MSEVSPPVTEEFFRYLAKRTAQEDSFLHDLKIEVHAEGIPPIWTSPEQGQLKANIVDGYPCRITSRLNGTNLTIGRLPARNGPTTQTYGFFKKTAVTLRFGEDGC